MMNDLLEQTAREYEQAATELEVAVRHLRTTAQHFRDSEIPRAAAHAWAAWGHLVNAEQLLTKLAQLHASRSQP